MRSAGFAPRNDAPVVDSGNRPSSVNVDEARGLGEESAGAPTTPTLVSAEVVAFDIARSGPAGLGPQLGLPTVV